MVDYAGIFTSIAGGIALLGGYGILLKMLVSQSKKVGALEATVAIIGKSVVEYKSELNSLKDEFKELISDGSTNSQERSSVLTKKLDSFANLSSAWNARLEVVERTIEEKQSKEVCQERHRRK